VKVNDDHEEMPKMQRIRNEGRMLQHANSNPITGEVLTG
jgi:hypothetical protein